MPETTGREQTIAGSDNVSITVAGGEREISFRYRPPGPGGAAINIYLALGTGRQIGDPLYQDGYRDGIRSVSGRADSFAYDPVGKRLFVAIGEGGIWMSEATDGDVGTLRIV